MMNADIDDNLKYINCHVQNSRAFSYNITIIEIFPLVIQPAYGVNDYSTILFCHKSNKIM